MLATSIIGCASCNVVPTSSSNLPNLGKDCLPLHLPLHCFAEHDVLSSHNQPCQSALHERRSTHGVSVPHVLLQHVCRRNMMDEVPWNQLSVWAWCQAPVHLCEPSTVLTVALLRSRHAYVHSIMYVHVYIMDVPKGLVPGLQRC